MKFILPENRRGNAGKILLMIAAGMVAVLTGCETVSDVPMEDAYQPPPAGAPVAFLKGTSISEGGLFGTDHRGFVAMVDLKTVLDAADHWSDSLPLTTGRHTIAAEYRYSNFMTRAYLTLEAKAGVTYQLMIKSGHDESPQARLYSDFWIVDAATGEPVTPVFRRQATGGKKGGSLFKPTS